MAKATLKTLARATGYSITTVSRALGGFDDVNEETRQAILAEAYRQGYEPNLQARALQKKRSQTIGLVLPTGGPSFPDPFFGEFLSGVGSEAAQAGFDLLVSTASADLTEIDVYRRIVAGGRVDGVILMRSRVDDERIRYLLERHFPFAVFGRTDIMDEAYSYIDVDGRAGQAAMTRHLIDRGHERIAYMRPPATLMFSRFRQQGYREAMAEAGIAIDERLVVECDLTENAGKRQALRLLKLKQPPTAIMAGNDLMAIGVMNAVREMGLRVGEDVAVGGFDDIPAAEHLNPGLTTIRQPIFHIGQQLTERLLQLIEGSSVGELSTLVEPELILRGSSNPPQPDRQE
ncbi:MAG: LacI family DNA-binding transcriptional regulator [Anaerolineae bacterium]|nr:LacI family DNA-binding transcriptional regulator [Anaerolineae bacterium]